jgi:hypothetical protein
MFQFIMGKFSSFYGILAGIFDFNLKEDTLVVEEYYEIINRVKKCFINKILFTL